jgi:hypothetical protein
MWKTGFIGMEGRVPKAKSYAYVQDLDRNIIEENLCRRAGNKGVRIRIRIRIRPLLKRYSLFLDTDFFNNPFETESAFMASI